MNLCAEGGSTGKTRSQTCARLPATINLLPLWNWYKYLHNSPIVRFFGLEAAVMYIRFTVARPPWRAVASLTRRQISRVELLGQPMRLDMERLDR